MRKIAQSWRINVAARPFVLAITLFLGMLLGALLLYVFQTQRMHIDATSTSADIIIDASPSLLGVSTKELSHPRIEIVDNSSHGVTKKVRDPRLTHLLELELKFESTLKSCLSSYCFDEPVKVNGKSLGVRIGFLAPPESGSDTLIAMLNRAARKDLIATNLIENNTHVPAYGYGKNHGWTRIVRLVRRVIPHALATLSHETESVPSAAISSPNEISADLFDLQVRQFVRWQCRLSHVAAHTKMLTVFMDDVLLRPVIELDKILSFIGIRAPRSDLVDASNEFGRRLQADLGVHGVDFYPTTHVSTEHLDGLPAHLIAPALSSLENEMTSTDTLAKWPCKSFKDLESKGLGLPIPAATLAAECQNPKVVCSVGFDKQGG